MTVSGDRYNNSYQQVVAELGWLELLIKREITLIRHGKDRREKFDEFSGLYVSEEDIDTYLNQVSSEDRDPPADPEIKLIEENIRVTRDRLDQKAQASVAAGVDLRLSRIASTFKLDSAEILIFLACLAPDVDLKFQKYFAYLQNDVSKRRPTIQLLRHFGLGKAGPPIAARSLFGIEGSLFTKGMLVLPADKAEDCFPLFQPRVPSSIADFLAGIDRVDDSAAPVVSLSRPSNSLGASKYFDRHRALLHKWGAKQESFKRYPTVLVGADGCGKSELIAAFAALLAKNVLTIDYPMLSSHAKEVDAQLKFLDRDARLLQAVVHIMSVSELRAEEGSAQTRLTGLAEVLAKRNIEYLFISSCARTHEIDRRLPHPTRCYELPLPSIDERVELWQQALPASLLQREPQLACDLATRFVFSPEKVRAAAFKAESNRSIDKAESDLTASDYFQACRLESNQNLQRFGKKMLSVYRWNDLVLPQDTKNQLREICNCVRHKQLVYEGWGFGAKYSLGKGLNVLFAGASGTGKTMCAEIIAADLELDVFKIDLSCVVSKYVGETERNLSRIFEEAETSNSILFFDEADALFGKRSEVKDAHDRYANIEINYLLQRLDDYGGIVILATNLRGNLDKAFTRRLNYVVEFPFPDQDYRRLIWSQVFPGDTPISDDVKLDFLARKFKLSGGNIKNIAVNSAFLASGNGKRVTMEHLILATKREYQKLGRLCTKSEFGPYFNLIQETGI